MSNEDEVQYFDAMIRVYLDGETMPGDNHFVIHNKQNMAETFTLVLKLKELTPELKTQICDALMRFGHNDEARDKFCVLMKLITWDEAGSYATNLTKLLFDTKNQLLALALFQMLINNAAPEYRYKEIVFVQGTFLRAFSEALFLEAGKESVSLTVQDGHSHHQRKAWLKAVMDILQITSYMEKLMCSFDHQETTPGDPEGAMAYFLNQLSVCISLDDCPKVIKGLFKQIWELATRGELPAKWVREDYQVFSVGHLLIALLSHVFNNPSLAGFESEVLPGAEDNIGQRNRVYLAGALLQLVDSFKLVGAHDHAPPVLHPKFNKLNKAAFAELISCLATNEKPLIGFQRALAKPQAQKPASFKTKSKANTLVCCSTAINTTWWRRGAIGITAFALLSVMTIYIVAAISEKDPAPVNTLSAYWQATRDFVSDNQIPALIVASLLGTAFVACCCVPVVRGRRIGSEREALLP